MELVNDLRFVVSGCGSVGVMLGNGKIENSYGLCKQVVLTLHELQVVDDFYPLELGSTDMILGIKWLQTLVGSSPISGRPAPVGARGGCHLIETAVQWRRRIGLEIRPTSPESEEILVCWVALSVSGTGVLRGPTPRREIEFLVVHIVTGEGVMADPSKIAAMVDWPLPKNIEELRGFLGLTSYYRKFVKGYEKIAWALTEQLKKDTNFHWNDEATYASGSGVGAVLMQEGKPIAYFSQVLGIRAKLKSVYERELMAIVLAVKKWRPYLMGRRFIIQYRPGKDNSAADALSRRAESVEYKALSVPSVYYWDELLEDLERDPELEPLREKVIEEDGSCEGYTIDLNTLHFLKFPENSFEVLKLLGNSVEVLKIMENKLESMNILENKLESLKHHENQPTQFDLTPHMQSQRWTDINAGIQQYLQKLYNTNKASLKAAHWVINPETGTNQARAVQNCQNRAKSTVVCRQGSQSLARLPENQIDGELSHSGEEMLRLQALGSNTPLGVPYTDEEINALARKGKQRGHLPGVGRVLPGRATDWFGDVEMADDEDGGKGMKVFTREDGDDS
ncbi:putative mitochondrial protein [Tanacetum coccineum]|uniref:Mitochondrial protein n=1 Tax=Tanacetum coccineum TaxID=301880 RepID=A0ABQ4YMJ3_9ASTR